MAMNRYRDSIPMIVALAALVLILGSAFLVIMPFLIAILWAIILVCATWRPFQWLSKSLGNRSTLAATLVVTVLVLFILIPLVLATIEFAQQIAVLARIIQGHIESGSWPELPVWMTTLPYVGEWLQSQWAAIQQQDLQVLNQFKGIVTPILKMMLQMAGSVGAGLLMLLISLLIAGVFYARGDIIYRWLLAIIAKIAPQEGLRLLGVAHVTIRGVVNGFIGAAIAQGVLAWIGLMLAGVPYALTLGLATCFFSIIPGGPLLLALPAIGWLYQTHAIGWAIFVVVWTLGVVGTIDNVVKSLVIGRNSPLPISLILVGVAGGAISFGLLGVFLGPILLSLVYALLKNWVNPVVAP